MRTINHFYLEHPCLWQVEDSWDGFKWIVPDDSRQNIIVFRRIDEKDNELVVICNFAPVARPDYRIGVPQAKGYSVLLCSNDPDFGGTGTSYHDELFCENIPSHSFQYSIKAFIPPLSTIWLKPNGLKKRRASKQKQPTVPHPKTEAL